MKYLTQKEIHKYMFTNSIQLNISHPSFAAIDSSRITNV